MHKNQFMTNFTAKRIVKMITFVHCLMFCLFLKYSMQDEKIEICFPKNGVYKNYFPPINDSDFNIYSTSNRQRIGRPIVAYLCTKSLHQLVRPNDPKFATLPKTFTIKSQPVGDGSPDCIANTDKAFMKVCLYAANNYELIDPRRFDKSNMKKVCSKKDTVTSELIIPKIKLHGIYLVVQGLSHEISDSEEQFCLERRIVLSISVQGKPIDKPTNPFKIFSRIPRLNWSDKPTDEIVANHPFNMSLQIIDSKNNRITTGFDSTLIAQVTISFEVKRFTQAPLVRDFLHSTEVELAGDEVVISLRNYDKVLHKRAEKGFVQFNNVVILDEYQFKFLLLNATLLLPLSGDRQPLDYSDLSSSCLFHSALKNQFSCHEFCDYLNCSCSNDKEKSDFSLYSHIDCIARMSTKAVSFTQLKISAQTAASLYIADSEDATGMFFAENLSASDKSVRVSCHFQIPNLWVIVIDSEKRRIFSGPDSDLTITVLTEPTGIKLTGSEIIFKTHRGLGRFMGAVKEIVDKVQFQFTAEGRNGVVTSNLSRSFEITGVVNFALFGRFDSAGHKGDPDPVTETFAQLAVEDINDKVIPELELLPQSNIKINLKICDHKLIVAQTAELFLNILEDDGEEAVAGIIAFGANTISAYMHGLVNSFQMPVVAYREDKIIFIRKGSFKTTFCLDWTFGHSAPFIGQYFQLQYNYLIIFQDENFAVNKDLKSAVQLGFQYTVAYRVTIKNQRDLTKEIAKAKRTGVKFIFHLVQAPKQYFLFREAIKNKFAPMHGYHWFTIESYAKEFDWENDHPFCAEEPKCTEAFQGMQMMVTTHNLSGYSTPLWYHVNRKFYERNPIQGRGFPTMYTHMTAEQFALGYDSVLTFAHALVKQLNSHEAITKLSMVESIHGLSFEGLTGIVQFSKTRNWRKKPIIALMNVVQDFPRNTARWLIFTDYSIKTFMYDHIIKKRSTITGQVELEKEKYLEHAIEIPIECPPNQCEQNKMVYIPIMLSSNNNNLIARFYISTCGYLSKERQFISKNKTRNNKQICLRTDLKIATYTCKLSCGGGRISSDTASEYRFGVCISPNECSCRTVMHGGTKVVGYSGNNCANVICTCYQGNCIAPYTCVCDSGWTGSDCNIPICRNKCVHGNCIKPNVCQCNVGYYGETCTILLGMLVTAILFSIIVVAVFVYFLYRVLKKRNAEQELLRNLDWLVDWNDVTEKRVHSSQSTPTSTMVGFSTLTSTKGSRKGSAKGSLAGGSGVESTVSSVIKNVVVWKGSDYYAKKLERDSLNKNLLTLRTEIKKLRELKHPNLVRFFGACLTAPNVALLLEIVPKGSLFDILQLHVYNLTWSFKFSILRDIATGMEYLHKSEIGSHGNLKSTNCLIDNRWTCKVSGFGVATMRKKVYSVENLKEIYFAMLWTAPELLQNSMTPNDVGIGTKLGDIYSFGIILTEICTHETPFTIELEILAIEELVRLIKNFHDPATRGIKKCLESHNYDTSKPIRPALGDASLPELYAEKKGILDLLNTTTNENPGLRPSFKEIIGTLQKIHPLKGQLVENLIFMLEKYANHLEDMFSDKVTEVRLEKLKTEELISRLLPPTIADQMKMHQEIPPEKFENVTILYSDIVGFTAVAKASKPMEVVELLNDLYTRFDNIIESFETYKIETIGDAYCVTSGVPVPVQDHYEQIGTMALYFLAAVDSLPIRHMPNEKLKVRIGIHSGSCVAGVVGIKMPRYCIFGEDVIIAQYMESHGYPNCIQCSESTAKLLDKVGLYYIVYRAEMTIKLLGNFHTYWLIGKQGIDIILPSISARESVTGLSFITNFSQKSGAMSALTAATPVSQAGLPMNATEHAAQIRKSITEELRKSFSERRSDNGSPNNSESDEAEWDDASSEVSSYEDAIDEETTSDLLDETNASQEDKPIK